MTVVGVAADSVDQSLRDGAFPTVSNVIVPRLNGMALTKTAAALVVCHKWMAGLA